MNWTTEPPTKPGAYWFKPETHPSALLVDGHLRDGQLTVWWPNKDQPVAKLNGH
jgi:hypothetical protein